MAQDMLKSFSRDPEGSDPAARHSRSPSGSRLNNTATDWLSYLLYEGTYWLSAMSFVLGWSLRTDGMHNVPGRGPVLFISNHQSFLDPLLIGLAVRRHLHFLSRKSLFRFPVFAWLIRRLNAVPIDQEGSGIEGLKVTLRLLKEGRAMVVFPEGERTYDGAIHPLEAGVQLLIRRARAPIVPVAIAGAYEAWSRWRRLPIPAPLFLPPAKGTLAVSVGKPLDTARLADLPRPDLLQALFVELTQLHQHAERLRRK